MKRSFLILLSLIFMISMVSGCSQSGSNYEYDTPQIKSISSGRTGVSITIEAVEGVKSYRILRKNEDQKWAVYAHSKSSNYIDENVESAGTYSYTVLCESEDGKTPLSSFDKEGKTITFVSMPELAGISNAFGGVKIEWKAPKGAQSYRVFRKTGLDAEWEKVVDTKSLSCTDINVESGKEYIYTVRCMDKNSKRYTSHFNSDGLTITYYDAPVLSNILRINGTVRLSWRSVEGADQYRVYRKDEATGWAAIDDTTARNYVDTTAEEGKTYTYTVRCLDVYGRLISAYDPEGISISF